MGFIFPSTVHEGCILLWPHFNCCLVSILLSRRLTLPQKTQEETAQATAIIKIVLEVMLLLIHSVSQMSSCYVMI